MGDCLRGLACPVIKGGRFECSVKLARLVFMASAMCVQQRHPALDYVRIARAVQPACIYLYHFMLHLSMPLLDPTRGQRRT